MSSGLLYAGKVVDIVEQGPLVLVPLIAQSVPQGPMESSVPDLAIGDRVLVTNMGDSRDLLVVVGRLPARTPTIPEIPNLQARLVDIENVNTAQNSRLTSIESLDITQNNRLTAIESLNTTQNSRLSAVETLNTTQNTRLDGIDTLNTTQNTRLTATEGVANGAQSAVTALDTAALHKATAETVTGVKTFSAEPVIPAATLATSPVRSDDSRLSRVAPLVVLTQANTQSIGNATWTAISFNQTEYDPFAIKNPSNSAQLIIPTGWAGYWEICGSVGYSLATAGGRLAAIARNNVRVTGSSGGGAAASNLQTVAVTPLRLVLCDVGDILAIHTYQTSGAALATALGELGCVVSARWVRPA